MPTHPFPTSSAASATNATRRRRVQQQQQPTRFWLNRQQQQQGYSEYQYGQAAPATSLEPQAVAFAGPSSTCTHLFRSTP